MVVFIHECLLSNFEFFFSSEIPFIRSGTKRCTRSISVIRISISIALPFFPFSFDRLRLRFFRHAEGMSRREISESLEIPSLEIVHASSG